MKWLWSLYNQPTSSGCGVTFLAWTVQKQLSGQDSIQQFPWRPGTLLGGSLQGHVVQPSQASCQVCTRLSVLPFSPCPQLGSWVSSSQERAWITYWRWAAHMYRLTVSKGTINVGWLSPASFDCLDPLSNFEARIQLKVLPKSKLNFNLN